MVEPRDRVIQEAQKWINTKFHHRGRILGGGVDCAGLLAEVYERAGVLPHIELPEYNPDWWLHTSEEFYRNWVVKYARETPDSTPGNIVLFGLKYRTDLRAVHSGIVVEWPEKIITAWPVRRRVKFIDASHEPGFHDEATAFYDPFRGPV